MNELKCVDCLIENGEEEANGAITVYEGFAFCIYHLKKYSKRKREIKDKYRQKSKITKE